MRRGSWIIGRAGYVDERCQVVRSRTDGRSTRSGPGRGVARVGAPAAGTAAPTRAGDGPRRTPHSDALNFQEVEALDGHESQCRSVLAHAVRDEHS